MSAETWAIAQFTVLMAAIGYFAERTLIQRVFHHKDRHVLTLLLTFGLAIIAEDALAERYVLLDNTYCCGILSADGHNWSTSAVATDYVERSFAGFPRSYPDGMGDGDFKRTAAVGAFVSAPLWYAARGAGREFFASWWTYARFQQSGIGIGYAEALGRGWDVAWAHYRDRPLVALLVFAFAAFPSP